VGAGAAGLFPFALFSAGLSAGFVPTLAAGGVSFVGAAGISLVDGSGVDAEIPPIGNASTAQEIGNCGGTLPSAETAVTSRYVPVTAGAVVCGSTATPGFVWALAFPVVWSFVAAGFFSDTTFGSGFCIASGEITRSFHGTGTGVEPFASTDVFIRVGRSAAADGAGDAFADADRGGDETAAGVAADCSIDGNGGVSCAVAATID
jgi:hypothetical protein